MDIKRLKDQIWTTRVSRINAERRLINKEKFIQVYLNKGVEQHGN